MHSIRSFGAACALFVLGCAPALGGTLIADLALTKTGPDTATSDSDITYTLAIANNGPDAASAVQLLDALPPELTFVSLTQDTGPAFVCTDPGAGNPGDIDCQIAALLAGASAQFTVVAHIDASVGPGSFITNIATASTASTDPNEKNNSAPAGTFIPSPQADLFVTKQGPASAAPDRDFEYTVSVGNAGPDPAADLTWQDTLPGDLTFVSLQQTSGPTMSCSTPAVGAGGIVTCSLATFEAGVTATFTLTVHVPVDAFSGTEYVNTATISSSTPDPSDENGSSTTTTVIAAVDLSVVKSGPASVAAGDMVSYDLQIANAGPDFATVVSLVDALPAPLTFVSLVQNTGAPFFCTTPAEGSNGTVHCSGSGLPASASAQFTLVAQAPLDTPDGTSVMNTATVTGEQFDIDTSNNASSVTTAITNTADVRVGKSAPATVTAGDDLVYTLVVANDGPDVAAGVALSDPLPAGTSFVSLAQTGAALDCLTPAVGAGGTVTCSAATLASGASTTLTLTVQVPTSIADGTVLGNTATVSSTSTDANATNDSQSVETAVVNQADLSLAKTAPATASAGGDLVYTLLLGNEGPASAANVSLDDVLPTGTTFVSLAQTGTALSCTTPAVGAAGTVACTAATYASGAGTTLTLTVRVADDAAEASTISNTATVATTTTDPDSADNTATAETAVANQADLALTKTGPASASVGDDLVYTLVLTNDGPSPAASVSLQDPLPANTSFVSLAQSGAAMACTTPAVGATGTVDCTAATYADGASTTLTLTLQVSDAAPDAFTVANTATVSATTANPDPTDNTATAETTVSNQADLVLTKSAAASVSAGDDLVYTVVLTNQGPLQAASVSLEDVLPANTSFVSLAQSGAALACTTPAVGAAGTVACTAATYASGASTTLTLTVQVADGAAEASTISNTATVASATADPDPADNTATAETTVASQADLSLTKTGPASASAGDELVYTLVLTNDGPAPAASVSLEDPLPANTSFVSLVQSGAPLVCTTPAAGATGTVACTAASYADGASTTLTLTLQLSDAVPNAFVVSNTATVTSATADPEAADNTATATTNAGNAADLGVAKSGAATVVAGSNLVYTITASNAGPLPDDAALSDTLPAGTTFVSLVQNTGPAFACTSPAVGAAGTVSCTLADFASGANATFTLTVQVAASTANGTTIGNTVTVDGTRTDPDASDDSATATTTVSNLPNLVLAKTAPAQVEPGEPIAYVLDLANTGDAPALDVVLTDPLPAQTGFVSLLQNTGPAFACSTPAVGSNGTVSCTIAALPAGASARFTLTVSMLSDTGGTVTNNATATTSSPDAAPADNAASAGTFVGFGAATAPITIPALSWFGLLALVAAIGLLGAAMTLRAR